MPQSAVKNSEDSLQQKPVKIAEVTPMMKQFLALKQAHEDYLLFYRMGDFYELFFDDAVVAAGALNISLTQRGKHLGKDIPMCGVSHHSSDQYLYKLIEKGFKVAICEQMESPAEAKKRGYKSVVKREVTRIVTAGTLTEDALLDATSSNYLLAINKLRNEVSLAWLDISTGEFVFSTIDGKAVLSEISRINPQEVLICDKLLEDGDFESVKTDYTRILTPYVSSFFDGSKGDRKLRDFYKVASLESFGEFSKCELGVCGALLEYVGLTQIDSLPRLEIPKKFATAQYMHIDGATRANLELVRTLSGEYKGSLLSVINRTVSNAGNRLFYQNLNAPLMDVMQINMRLQNVEFFVNNENLCTQLREFLAAVPDIERCLARIYMGRGSPRDLLAIRQSLQQSTLISDILEHSLLDIPDGIRRYMGELGNHDDLSALLQSGLNDEVGFHARDGGFIRSGFDPKLDDYQNTSDNAVALKDALRQQYILDTKIPTLKIKQNNVIGMFIEVAPQHTDKIPKHFIHRQTLGSAARFTTQELRELESKIVNAKAYALEREMELFAHLVQEILQKADNITLTAHALAGLDVACGNADVALKNNYCKPVIDESLAFEITSGRHPIVEKNLGNNFISNDCDLSDSQRLWLITGPNMAGKSTFLRQNAIITIMAQMGAYVPADKVHIGMVDRVFSRVGAADDLARGRSTFMVEMVETATILNNATDKSLVILDEIGRGTATYDGLSIAWSVLEYLHNQNKSRGLFATHYHELTALSEKLASLTCHTVKVREWNDEIIFLHEVIAGIADRSYGVHVAKLAGLPKKVTNRADKILQLLQKNESDNISVKFIDELPLFAHNIDAVERESEVEQSLKKVDVDSLTPRQALEILYELKGKM